MSDSERKPKRRHQTQISVWVSPKTVAVIDKRVAQMQDGRLSKVHRSDVIRALIEKEFGIKDEDNESDTPTPGSQT